MGVARLYKFGTPYNAADLAGVQFAQTANVAYFVHIDRPEQKLTRNAHTDWTFAPVTYGPTIAAPTDVSASATSPNTTGYVATPYQYVITAISDDNGQESRASDIASVTNDLTLDGNYNTVSWTAVDGADRYAVYKGNNGVFGFIGGTEGTSLRDGTPVIVADLSDTPPKATNPFVGEGNYPSAITFHEGRKVLARTRKRPNAVFATQSADFENMDTSRPAKDDDAYSFALVGKRVNAVNQLVSTTSLLALTTDSIFSITGGDKAIGPNSTIPKKQSGRGSSRLPPIEIDETTFFQPNQGSAVRALGFSFDIDGYRSNNISIFSPHLFDNDTIVSWAYQTEPYSCIWAVMQSGVMLCFTWEQEQDVWGWTVCETAGAFEDVAVITEQGVDRVYVVVRRTIDGQTVRFYERMALPHGTDYTSACHLDCAVTQVYDPPSQVVTGLNHLEGETVSAFYDGYAQQDLVVTNGSVTLQAAASVVSVGLPYTAEIETLPLVLATQGGSAHVNRQTINKVVVRSLDTKGVEVAIAGGEFEAIAERLAEPMGALPDIAARDYEVKLPAYWDDSATLVIRQTQPMPMHVTGLFMQPDIGDD